MSDGTSGRGCALLGGVKSWCLFRRGVKKLLMDQYPVLLPIFMYSLYVRLMCSMDFGARGWIMWCSMGISRSDSGTLQNLMIALGKMRM